MKRLTGLQFGAIPPKRKASPAPGRGSDGAIPSVGLDAGWSCNIDCDGRVLALCQSQLARPPEPALWSLGDPRLIRARRDVRDRDGSVRGEEEPVLVGWAAAWYFQEQERLVAGWINPFSHQSNFDACCGLTQHDNRKFSLLARLQVRLYLFGLESLRLHVEHAGAGPAELLPTAARAASSLARWRVC